MNIFNRVVVVLLLIAIILISAAVVVLPKQALTVAREFVLALETYVSSFQGWLLMTIALLGVAALCVALLWLELRRPAPRHVRVEKISGGEARIAVESVAQRLQYNLDQLPQIVSVKPRVSARGKRVDVTLDIETTQDVNIPAKTEEMSQITRSVIEEQMGLKLGKMIVSVRHMSVPPLDRRQPAPVAPTLRAAPPEPQAAPQEAPPPAPEPPQT